jgi:hypothetical protein
MKKTFTNNFLRGLKKILLVTSIAFASGFLQAYTPHSFAANEIGIQAKAVKCYPNPAISFVNFEFLSELISKNYSLQVYSFTGKKMYQTNITTAKETLTFTNDFYRGLYYYKLLDNTGKIIETGKFQVSR